MPLHSACMRCVLLVYREVVAWVAELEFVYRNEGKMWFAGLLSRSTKFFKVTNISVPLKIIETLVCPIIKWIVKSPGSCGLDINSTCGCGKDFVECRVGYAIPALALSVWGIMDSEYFLLQLYIVFFFPRFRWYCKELALGIEGHFCEGEFSGYEWFL